MNKTSKPDQVCRFAGIAILAGFAALCCAGNASFTYLASQINPGDRAAILLWIIAGLFGAQGCALSIWLVLGDDSLRRRIAFVSLAIITAVSSWAFGSALTLDTSRSFLNQPEWKTVYILGFIPIIALGLSIPLLAMRFFFSRRLVRPSSLLEQKPGKTSNRFTIGQLLIVTTLIGIVGGGVEITANLLEPMAERWLAAGMVTAFALGVGLLVSVPFVVGLLRERGFYFWLSILPVYLAIVSMFTIIVIELTDSKGRRWLPRRLDSPEVAIGLIIVFMGVGLIIVLIGLRLVGFRLVKNRLK